MKSNVIQVSMWLSSKTSCGWWSEYERTDGHRRDHENLMIAYLLTVSGMYAGHAIYPTLSDQ